MVAETPAAPTDLEPSAAWRASQYVRLGLDAWRAVTLAERRGDDGLFVDWHRFEALVEGDGCDPVVAFEILA